MSNIVSVMAPNIAQFGAYRLGAVVWLLAALERGTGTILLLGPALLGLLDELNLGGGISIVKVRVEVVDDGSLIVLGARSARLLHEDGELVAGDNARTSRFTRGRVASDQTWKFHNEIQIIYKISDTVNGGLALTSPANGSVERLGCRLESEARMSVILCFPVSMGSIVRQISIKGAGGDELRNGSGGHYRRVVLIIRL